VLGRDVCALLPLCVDEIASSQAYPRLRACLPVVWWGSLVEVHSAISRLHRMGGLKDVEKQGAPSRLNMLNQGWTEILPTDEIHSLAVRLLEIHDYRAVDSV